MPSFIRNLRNVSRRLLRTPLFTLVAMMTLALGIGANSAVFSIVNGVLIKPLPFKDPERLVSIWYKAPGLGPGELNQGPAFHIFSELIRAACQKYAKIHDIAASF